MSIARITQVNPDVLMLPVVRDGEVVGRISLQRKCVPTDKPFAFSVGYKFEGEKIIAYEIVMVEDIVRAYLQRLVAAGISFTQAVKVSDRQTQIQPIGLDEATRVAGGVK